MGGGSGGQNPADQPASACQGSSAFPVVFGADCFQLCPHPRKPALEDIDDCVADFGRRKDGSVYKPTPAIDLIFSTDNHFIDIAIHRDEALGFLNLLDQIADGHGFRSPIPSERMGPASVEAVEPLSRAAIEGKPLGW